MSRTLWTIALLVTIGAPVAAQEKKAVGPAATAQIQPLDKLLADAKRAVQKFGGADAVKAIEQKIADELGEKGFTGIDQTKMFGGYVTSLKDMEAAGFMLMVPVTSEKEFLDLLKRMKFGVTVVKNAKGLTELTPPESAGADAKPVRMRVKDGYAYITFNNPDSELDAKKLLPIKDVVDPSDKNMLSIRTHLQLFSKAAQQKSTTQIAELTQMAEDFTGSPKLKEAFGELIKYIARTNVQQYRDGDIYSLSVNIDPNTLALTIESTLTALKGTQLAKDIAAMKPSTNQFAGLLPAQTAVGFKARLPLFAPEIRTAIELLLKEAITSTEGVGPEELQPLKKEAFQGLIRSVKAGNIDLAVAVIGPDANGKFAANLGLSFDDTTALDRELRKFYKTLPNGLQSIIKLDAAKVGEVNIHKADLGGFLPQEATQFLGDEVSVCLALAPKGLYVTVGKNALAQMKTGLQAKPEPAKIVDLVANMKRVAKLVSLFNPNVGEQLEKASDKQDELASIFSFAVDGGDALKFRVTLNLKPFGMTVATQVSVKE